MLNALTDSLHLLLHHGLSFDTALHAAIFFNYYHAFQSQLAKGCSVDSRNQDGSTPLMYAQYVTPKNMEMIKWRCEKKGADITARSNNDNSTALTYATISNSRGEREISGGEL